TAAAMEQGLGINTILDTPQTVRLPPTFGSGGCNDGSNDYCVKNYDGSYHSQYTVTQALAESPNTAFVKLIAATGVTPTVDMAVKLGLRSYATQPSAADPSTTIADLFKKQNLASFTLGPVPVDPVELSNVAATLSSGGRWCPPSPIASITDSTGKPVTVHTPACEQVVPSGLANTLANAMSQDARTGTAAGAARTVNWTLPMSSKTGTTEREYSSAFLGFTNTLAAANLVFDDSNTPSGICHDPLRSCSTANLTGGAEPARTWYAAINPIINNFGPVALPPTDPHYLEGTGKNIVPNVVGISVADATQQLSQAGFTVTELSQPNGSTLGTVIGQSISGPTTPGALITLDVSTGHAPGTGN
ncbi:MAG: penicillin-binding transpeptidase domain-containing protein, partial [Actinomycetota bacterium]|nr:penicillin-binding transpeptidase domain-containing protein [Actinomycetota bacterium]